MAGTTRPLRATIGATALATGLLLTAPSPALASDMQYSQDSCSAGPFAANYSVTYAPTTDGLNDMIYSIQWDITGPTVIHGLILNRWCFRWWSWCCDRCGVVCGCCWLSGRAPSGEFAPEVEVLAVGSFEGGV